MSRAFITAVLAALVGVLVVVPGAPAATGDLVLGKHSPSVGQTVTTGLPSLTFTVPTSCPGLSAYVDVARDEQYDPDGTLLGSITIDRFALEEVSSGTYSGSTSNAWLQTPGAYYWQVNGLGACNGGDPMLWVGPAIGLIVKSAGTTTDGGGVEVSDESEILTLAQARAAIPTIIKNVKKRIARGLKRTNCHRGGGGDLTVVFCTASWNDRRQYQYNGSWRIWLNDDGSIGSRFDGRRALLTCLKKYKGKNAKKCYKKHKFSYEL